MSEFSNPEIPKPDNQELLQARLENAKKSLEQAEIQLATVTDEADREIWQNRINQHREEVGRIEADIESSSEQLAA